MLEDIGLKYLCENNIIVAFDSVQRSWLQIEILKDLWWLKTNPRNDVSQNIISHLGNSIVKYPHFKLNQRLLVHDSLDWLVHIFSYF